MPLAASVRLPPVLLLTVWLTVSAPLLVTRRFAAAPPVSVTPLWPSTVPIVRPEASVLSMSSRPLVVLRAVTVETAVSRPSVEPMPVMASSRRLVAVMSVPAPPSVIAPVRAMATTRLPVLSRPLKLNAPSTSRRSSLKTDEFTVMVPVPSAVRPIVISLKPLASASTSASIRSSVEAPASAALPMLILRPAVVGAINSVPAPLVETVFAPPLKFTSSAVSEMFVVTAKELSKLAVPALVTVRFASLSVPPTAPSKSAVPVVSVSTKFRVWLASLLSVPPKWTLPEPVWLIVSVGEENVTLSARKVSAEPFTFSVGVLITVEPSAFVVSELKRFVAPMVSLNVVTPLPDELIVSAFVSPVAEFTVLANVVSLADSVVLVSIST